MREFISAVSQYAGYITAIAAAILLFIKPIRERVFGIKAIKEGMKCSLRSDMLRIYYRNRETQKIRQYEYENFCFMYKAYKALRGNSFIDHIKAEVDEWEVVT